MNEDDEQRPEKSSSPHLLVALEDLLNQSYNSSILISKIKYQSKSVDDLPRHHRNEADRISDTTRTELDLSGLGDDEDENQSDRQIQRSRSAPISLTDIDDRELAAFIQSDQSTNNFVFDTDLSYSNETSHQPNSRFDIFFEDDFTPEEIYCEPPNTFVQSSLINSCLTITEENEEELEQLRRDDDEEEQQQQRKKQSLLLQANDNFIPIAVLHDDNDNLEEKIESSDVNHSSSDKMEKCEDNVERLSTIYESLSSQFEIDQEQINDGTHDKLIVYDIAKIESSPISKSTGSISLSYRSPVLHRTCLNSCYTDASFKTCPNLTKPLSVSRLCGTTQIATSTFPKSSSLSMNTQDNSLSSPAINSLVIPPITSLEQQLPSQSSPMLYSILPNEHTLSTQDNLQRPPSSEHIKKMKVIQSSTSSLSDFLSPTPILSFSNTNYSKDVHQSLTNCSSNIDFNRTSISDEQKPSITRRILTNGLLYHHCATNPTPRRVQEPISSDSSSSTELLSSANGKVLSRSDFIPQRHLIPRQKASSLKSVHILSPRIPSKILYPIDFKAQKRSTHAVRFSASDSGILIDHRPTSQSSIEDEDNKTELIYRTISTELNVIKAKIVDIESRLSEAIQALKTEQTLIEGEHELVFKQILNASESDQQNLRQSYQNLRLLIERMMANRNSIENEMDYSRRILLQFEHELHELEQQYRSSDDKIVQKKELVAATRQKCEDLDFQLMELEARCESEVEQAEKHFQNEQKFVTQNARIRQNTLRDLDYQQYTILQKAVVKKEELEREKRKFKSLFKQKKLEANELEQRIHRDQDRKGHHSSNHQQRFSPAKPEKLTVSEQQLLKCIELEQQLIDTLPNVDNEVRLREKHRVQERPLTRYLPIRSVNFDLRAHIEGAAHLIDTPHLSLTSTTCRGYLQKMGGMKFKTWNRRWFVFDRQQRSLFYYQDRNETKLRGCIYFQSIVEVYIDHLQSISMRSPEPREATFIVKTVERSYYFVAPTVEAMRMWVDVIITGAEGNTFAGT